MSASYSLPDSVQSAGTAAAESAIRKIARLLSRLGEEDRRLLLETAKRLATDNASEWYASGERADAGPMCASSGAGGMNETGG
jgi:hypothetical protein